MDIESYSISDIAKFLGIKTTEVKNLATMLGIRVGLITQVPKRYHPISAEDAKKIIRLQRLRAGERIIKRESKKWKLR